MDNAAPKRLGLNARPHRQHAPAAFGPSSRAAWPTSKFLGRPSGTTRVAPSRIEPHRASYWKRSAAETGARENFARLDQRQYRNRLCDDRRSATHSHHAVHARKRLAGTQTHSTGLRREYPLHRSGRRIRRSHSHGAGTARQASGSSLLRRPIFKRCQLARRTSTMARPTKLATNRGAGPHFVSRCSEPAEHSWARRGG